MDIVISLMRIIVEQTTTARLDSTTAIPIANSNSTHRPKEKEKKEVKYAPKNKIIRKMLEIVAQIVFYVSHFLFILSAFVQKCHLLIKSPKREGKPLPK